jgi:hypothetical protein
LTEDQPSELRAGHAAATLGALLAAAVAVNAWWLHVHATPVMAGHQPLLASLRLNRLGLVEAFASVFGGGWQGRHSVYELSSLLTVGTLGESTFALIFVSTLWLVALLTAGYATAAQVGGRRAGLVAATLLACTPAAFHWSRVSAPAIAVMATALVGVALSLRAKGFTRIGPSVALGGVAALATYLSETAADNLGVLAVLGFVAAASLAWRLAHGPERARAIGLAAASAAVAVLLMDRATLGFFTQYAVGEAAGGYSGSLWGQPRALLAYPYLLWRHDLGPAIAVVTLPALVMLGRKISARRAALLAFGLGPLLLVTLLPKKNYNYTFAFVAAFPVVVAVAVASLENPRRRRAATAVVLAAGLAAWALGTFSAGDPPGPLSAGQRLFYRYFETAAVNLTPPARRPDPLLAALEETVGEKSTVLYGGAARGPTYEAVAFFVELLVGPGALVRSFVDPAPACGPDGGFAPEAVVLASPRDTAGGYAAWRTEPRPEARPEAWRACLDQMAWEGYQVRAVTYPRAPEFAPATLLLLRQ